MEFYGTKNATMGDIDEFSSVDILERVYNSALLNSNS